MKTNYDMERNINFIQMPSVDDEHTDLVVAI